MPERFGPPKSIRFFPSMSGRPGVEGNEFIFTRDLPTGVMPIRGVKGAENYRAALDPPDDHVAEQIVRLLDVGRFSRRELSEALEEFVETTTRYLGYRGEVIYEIATVIDRDTQMAELRLMPLPPGRVIRMPWAYYQVIPKADRKQLGKGWSVGIPRSKLWRVALPRRLGGVRRHRRMLKVLRRRSSPTPDFTLRRMDMGRGIGYDFSAHHKATLIGTERATRRWGTMPSFFRVEGTTEYFSFSRRLDFKRSQAELRDHILKALNSFLPRLDLRHRITVEGLVSPAKIGEMMSRLQAGDVTISEALDVDR
jgi:hypothetical protein